MAIPSFDNPYLTLRRPTLARNVVSTSQPLASVAGLSALAAQRHAAPLLAALLPRLTLGGSIGWRSMTPGGLVDTGGRVVADALSVAVTAPTAMLPVELVRTTSPAPPATTSVAVRLPVVSMVIVSWVELPLVFPAGSVAVATSVWAAALSATARRREEARVSNFMGRHVRCRELQCCGTMRKIRSFQACRIIARAAAVL